MGIEGLIKEIAWSHVEQDKVKKLFSELSNKNYDNWHGGEAIRGVLFSTKNYWPLAMRIYYINKNKYYPYPFLSLFKTITGDIQFEYTVNSRIDNVNKIRTYQKSPIIGQVFEFDKQYVRNVNYI